MDKRPMTIDLDPFPLVSDGLCQRVADTADPQRWMPVGVSLGSITFGAHTLTATTTTATGARITAVEPGGRREAIAEITWSARGPNDPEWIDTAYRNQLIPTATATWRNATTSIRSLIAVAVHGHEVPARFAGDLVVHYRTPRSEQADSPLTPTIPIVTPFPPVPDNAEYSDTFSCRGEIFDVYRSVDADRLVYLTYAHQSTVLVSFRPDRKPWMAVKTVYDNQLGHRLRSPVVRSDILTMVSAAVYPGMLRAFGSDGDSEAGQ